MLLSPGSFRVPQTRLRAASARNPAEIRCQNPDCVAVLDVTSIPVEYEAILRQLFGSHTISEQHEEITEASPSAITTDGSSKSSHESGTDATTTTITTSEEQQQQQQHSNITPSASSSSSSSSSSSAHAVSPLAQVAAHLDAAALNNFREAAKCGDSVSFTCLVAELSSRPSATALPLCDECMAIHLKQRTAAWPVTMAARDAAIEARNAIEHVLGISSGTPRSGAATTSPTSSSSSSSSSKILSIFLSREETLQEEIQALSKRLEDAKRHRHQLASKRSQLAAIEAGLWSEGRDIARQLQAGRERMYALRLRGEKYRDHVSKLRRLSVHSDAFFVWHRGPFATINSARLGRLPGIPVEWPEINAALGQMALLLSTLAARLGFLFSKYRVIPMGSYSKLAPPTGDERAAFELYYDGSFFATSRLNNALKALATCVAELGAYAESTDRSFRLPYAMSPGGDKIGENNLPIVVGKDIPWTRAMKLMATNLKWLVAWAFRQPPPALTLQPSRNMGSMGSSGGGGGGSSSGINNNNNPNNNNGSSNSSVGNSNDE